MRWPPGVGVRADVSKVAQIRQAPWPKVLTLTSKVLVADLPSSALSLERSRSWLMFTEDPPKGSMRLTDQNLRTKPRSQG